MDDTESVGALIGDIYDAAIQPERWRMVLGRIRGFVGGSSAGIVLKDTAAGRGTLCYDDGGVSREYTEMYFDRFVTLDPCTTGHFFSSVDSPVTTSDLVPHDILVESRFYQEWAEPQHLIDYMGAAIDRSATTATIFNVMRRRGDGMFNEDARQRMRMVAKHVKRAVLIGRVIDKTAARASAFAETMDGISAGMFLVDAAGSIVHANTAGERLLADGTVVRASGLRLLATDAKADRAFNEAVGSAENGDAAIGDRGIALPLAGRDGDYHVAHVLPLSGGERRLTGADYNATAAIFVRKAEMEKANAPEAIVKAYRLTPTELRVLLAIVEVGGVPEVADSLGVAEATVKTHLGHLYAKTGTGRQADLVKLVAGFSSPLLN